MEIDEVIDFLIKQIKKAKNNINYYVDIHYFAEESLWHGELNACLKIATFIYRQTNDTRLLKILHNEYK
jgi:hypothetical protein